MCKYFISYILPSNMCMKKVWFQKKDSYTVELIFQKEFNIEHAAAFYLDFSKISSV